MKILYFIENLRSGGKERRLLELLIYIKQTTSYSIVLVLMDDWVDYPYLQKMNISYVALGRTRLKKDPLVFKRFYDIVQKTKPDIIHTWGPTATFYAIPTKILTRRRLVANIISNAKKSYDPLSFKHLVYKMGFLFSDVILSNSKAGLKAYGVDDNPKSNFIYNGVRLERFNVKIDEDVYRRSLGINDKKIILMVASTAKNKDYDLLIDIAIESQKKKSEIFFLAVGRGPELGRLKSRVAKSKLSNIIFLGGRTDVEELISIADICVLFTNNAIHGEGISNSLIEYMAMSKPVISTDRVGGTSEVIDEGETGFIAISSASNILKKIEELLASPDEIKKLGANGRQKVERRFSIDIMGQRFVDLYSEL
ncbi:glycosyltransferase [Sphingobacterium phlebotomi]|uniref:Glycosyltransferase n=1 Tax=Sphingobacterium phlebotomi TaxID=2605433 RepID=A0A5D4H9D9_9SPHI|nr:glycosyltransferase [Sphingobacterium phlebotomi]TYR36843.1 glycosyltransferase [Sphingobacterium phlebotomi]